MNNFIFLFLYVFILFFNNISGGPKYTDKEKVALTKFRELMGDALYKDYMRSDPYLIRWLRARDFDLSEASKMLHRALKWRRDNQIDGIISENIFHFQNPPFYFAGVDREGSPVGVGFVNKVDPRGLLLTGKKQVLIRYGLQLLEFAETAVFELLGFHPHGYTFANIDPSLKFIGNDSLFARINNESDKAVGIVDAQGFNLRQHACLACLRVYVEALLIYENYYPGYAKRGIVINAPRIAKPMIDLFIPLLSPAFREVIEIYGSNRSEWIPALQKIIPPNQLSKYLGGTKAD